MVKSVLNRKQISAVRHRRGPLLIIAGAGTGKTTVITERINWLIEKKLARSSQILALTFTEKAATEMEERVDKALPYGYTQTWIMTFHSFCDRILRDEGLHIGLSTNYKLLSSAAAISLFRQHLFNSDMELDYFRPLGNPNKFISGLLDHFDRLRDEDVTSQQYKLWVKKKYRHQKTPEADQYHELSFAYTAFQQIKLKEGYLDFADLISETLRLFRTRPHILVKYQNIFKYILVDEYQDTNYAQNRLVDLLAQKNRNLTVVADDDQSIYRWRGAALSNVISFRDVYPDARLIVLTQNYRSTQEILDSAYRLIQNNNPDRLEVKEKINKHLKSSISNSSITPEHMHFRHQENEAEGVAQKIIQLLSMDTKLNPADIAILVRANAHAQPFITALSRRGLKTRFFGPSRLFDRSEIKEMIAFLQVIRDPADSAAFFRVLSMDFFALPAKELITLSNLAQKNNVSIFELCGRSDLFPTDLSQKTKELIVHIFELTNLIISKSLKLSAGQVLYEFIHKTGMLSALLKYQHPIQVEVADNISHFFSQLKRFETENFDASVPSVLDWIELTRDSGTSPTSLDTVPSETDTVNILTIHSAKGLEFSVVFMVNLVSGRFPSISRREQIPIPQDLIKEKLPAGDFHLQEERRLFYVGITRAKNLLFLTSSDYYAEAKRMKKPSPFLAETLGINTQALQETHVEQLSLSEWQSSPQSQPNSSTKVTKITYLSYSQIQTFLDCPLHYKAKYILKIPSPSSPASSFGNTIHKTMRDYHDSLLSSGKPDIKKIFSANWSPLGYISEKHAQKYFDLGIRYLTEFISLNPFNTSPVILEQPFTFRLGNLKIGGKIDRADIHPDGTLEIIDYKTSKKQLDTKAAARDLQLSFYALAATNIQEEPFNRIPEQVKLTLYYFDQQSKVSVTQTADQLEKAKEDILSIAREIETSDFSCSGSIICQGKCDYNILCDIYLDK